MTRRSVEPTRRFHLFLYKRDLDYLERRFGAGAASAQRLGVGTACREIIHNRVKQLRARENERLTAIAGYINYDDDHDFANVEDEGESHATTTPTPSTNSTTE